MKTTINIHRDILEKITLAAQLHRISRTKMIIKFMNIVMDDIKNNTYLAKGNGVRYQNRRKSNKWHRFHIKLMDNEYEYILDLRKVMKMSVSLILAYAVKKYLKKILNRKNRDNYRLHDYKLSMKLTAGVIIWKLYWITSPDPVKHIRL